MRIIIILTLIVYVSTAPVAKSVYQKILDLADDEYKCPYLRSTIITPNKPLIKQCDDFQKTQNITKVDLYNLKDALCGLYYDIFKNTCKLTNFIDGENNTLPFEKLNQNENNISVVCQSIAHTLKNSQVNSAFTSTNDCEHICKEPISSTVYPICQVSSSIANIYIQMEKPTKPTTPTPVRSKPLEKEIVIAEPKSHDVQPSHDVQIASLKNLNTPSSIEIPKPPFEPQLIDSHQVPPENPAPQNIPKQTQLPSNQPSLTNEMPPKNQSVQLLVPQENSRPNLNEPSLTQDIFAAENNDKSVKAAEPEKPVPKLNEKLPTSTLKTVVPSDELENQNEEDLREEIQIEPKDDSAEKQMAPPNMDLDQPHDEDYGDGEVEEKGKDAPVVPVKPLKTNEDNLSVGYPNQSISEGDSDFFLYFMVVCVASILGYVGYHNKQKILAIVLEGRKGRRSQRRRPNSANYHKLDCNLEEAVTSSCNKNTTNVIY